MSRPARWTVPSARLDGGVCRAASQPDRDDAQATDQITEDLLRMRGVPADGAHETCDLLDLVRVRRPAL